MTKRHRLPKIIRYIFIALAMPAGSISLAALLLFFFPYTPLPSSPITQPDSASVNRSLFDNRNPTIGNLSSGLSLESQPQPLLISQSRSLSGSGLTYQAPPTFDTSSIKLQPLFPSVAPFLSIKSTDSTLADLVNKTSLTSPFTTPLSTVSQVQTSAQSASSLPSTLLPSLILFASMLIALATFRLNQKQFASAQRLGSLTVKKTKLEIRKLERDLEKEEAQPIIITDRRS